MPERSQAGALLGMYLTAEAAAEAVGALRRMDLGRARVDVLTDSPYPEGAFGVGKGTTSVVAASWVNHDASDSTIDWFKGTIPGSNQISGSTVRALI